MQKCTATINLDAIYNNYLYAKFLAKKNKIIAVIKANAYGHGLVYVANKLAKIADGFAVANIDEAMQLRNIGINNKIIILNGIFTAAELIISIKNNFNVVVHNNIQLQLLANINNKLTIWLKFNSGMNRLGFNAHQFKNALTQLQSNKNIKIILMSHLACADDINSDFTKQQIIKFNHLTTTSKLAKSLANSAGILHWESSCFDYNRIGIMLFGISPIAMYSKKLQMSMTLSAPIIAIQTIKSGDSVGYNRKFISKKNMTIAIVAIGYGDGYPRISKPTPVYLNNKHTNTLGVVSMDSLIIDITNIATKIGDIVELFGANIDINQLAQTANTISYELICRITHRVKKKYLGTI